MISVVLATSEDGELTEDVAEVCSDACSVLGDVAACLSLGWSALVALEAGFRAPPAAGAQSVAGDWKGLSGCLVSPVAGWLGLGWLAAVGSGPLVLSESWETS